MKNKKMGIRGLLLLLWVGTNIVNASESSASNSQGNEQQLPHLRRPERSRPQHPITSVDEELQQEFGDFIIIVPEQDPQLGVRSDEQNRPKIARPIPRSPRVPLPIIRSRKLLPKVAHQGPESEDLFHDLIPPAPPRERLCPQVRIAKRLPSPSRALRVKRVTLDPDFVAADAPNHRFDGQIRAMRRACVECIEIWNQMCIENRNKPIQLDPDEINPENLDEQDPLTLGMRLLSYRVQIAASCLRDGDRELYQKVGGRRWYRTFYDLMTRYGAFMWKMTRQLKDQPFDRAMRYLSKSLEFDLKNEEVLGYSEDDEYDFEESDTKQSNTHKRRRKHLPGVHSRGEDVEITAPVEDDKQTFCGDVGEEIDIPIEGDSDINQAARRACEFLFRRSLEILDEQKNEEHTQIQGALQVQNTRTQEEKVIEEEDTEEESEGIEIII